MIERDQKAGEQTVVCDECGDYLDENFSTDDFSAMILHLKTEGWGLEKSPTGWDHTCPDCKRNRIRELLMN